jgi:hypothetical protein
MRLEQHSRNQNFSPEGHEGHEENKVKILIITPSYVQNPAKKQEKAESERC